MEVVAFEAALGAEIRGVDLSQPLQDSLAEEILNAWHKHLVLRFRDQKITDHDLAALLPVAGVDAPKLPLLGSQVRESFLITT